jgi:diguanylate cyclase (GGDEF)-like protein
VLPFEALLILEFFLFALGGALLLLPRHAKFRVLSLHALSGMLGTGGLLLARQGRTLGAVLAGLGAALGLLAVLRLFFQPRGGDDWLDPLRGTLQGWAAGQPVAAAVLAVLLGAGWQTAGAAAFTGLLLGGGLFTWMLARLPAVSFLPAVGQALADSEEDGVLVLNQHGRVAYFNPAAQAIFGAETLAGRPWKELLAIWWQPALQLWEEGQSDFEFSMHGGPPVHSYHVCSQGLPAGAGENGCDGRLVILRDLSAQRSLEQRLAVSETTDALTGLANRTRLLEMAEREVYRARRYRRPLSVLMLQVNGFAAINDEYGHAAGDQVVQTLAQRCRENIRLADIPGRWSEDSFALLLPETDQEKGLLAAERIRRILSGLPILTQTGLVNVTLSAGVVALSEEQPLTAAMLLDQAAGELFEARFGEYAGAGMTGNLAAAALPGARLRR